uniref:Bromodomain-containing protein n=1 Tax=Panagrolaimus davidi TaxID=227884 RepID=A0A914PQL8_9BILA
MIPSSEKSASKKKKGGNGSVTRANREHPSASAVTETPRQRHTEPRAAKRKAETQLAGEEVPAEKKLNTKIKNRPASDFSNAPPRYHGELSQSMIDCQMILDDFLAKKSHYFTSEFIAPVDVEFYQPADYYDIIKQPMDLTTIKNNFDNRQYENVNEFRQDMLLIAENCMNYNHSELPVYVAAKKFSKCFEDRWKRVAKDEPPPQRVAKDAPPPPKNEDVAEQATSFNQQALASSSPSLIKSLVVNDSDDDQQIDLIVLRLQYEGNKLTGRIQEIQKYVHQLLNLKHGRMNAKSRGEAVPMVSSELHAAIQTLLSPSLFQPMTTPSISSAPPLTEKSAPSPPPPHPALKHYAAVTPAIPPQPTREAVSGPHRPTRKPSAAVTPPQPTREAVSGSSASLKSKRGRKRGSKNKSIPDPSQPTFRDDDYIFNSDDEKNFEPMTYDEKRQLSQYVNELSGDHLAKVVSIVEAREQPPNFNPEEIEIDFETLKPVTLLELDAYISSLRKKDEVTKPNTPRTHVATEIHRKEMENFTSSMNGTAYNHDGSSSK